MFDRLPKIFIRTVVVSIFTAGLWATEPPVDQGELDLIETVQKTRDDPQELMDALKHWEREYPHSNFAGTRSLAMAQADSQIIKKALQGKPTLAEMDAAKNAAIDLLNNLDKYLAPENKPTDVGDDQWKRSRQELEYQARAALLSTGSQPATPLRSSR
jgi:hypothetical protein